MREIEKLDAGLEYCFFDKEVVKRKEEALIKCRKFNSIDPTDFEAQEKAIKDLFGSTKKHVYVHRILIVIMEKISTLERIF